MSNDFFEINLKHLALIVILCVSVVTVCAIGLNWDKISGNSEIVKNSGTTNSYDVTIDKLEIYHFHATSQCYSCVTVGAYAEETVNTYFKDELEKGVIVFDHINVELPENQELVKKYGATGSSLWLGTYNGDAFKAEENINEWYKINNKEAYMNYLKGVIEQKLAGN